MCVYVCVRVCCLSCFSQDMATFGYADGSNRDQTIWLPLQL